MGREVEPREWREGPGTVRGDLPQDVRVVTKRVKGKSCYCWLTAVLGTLLILLIASVPLLPAPAAQAQPRAAIERFAVVTAPNDQLNPAISGNIVVWEDYRASPAGERTRSDIYGRDLRTGEEFRISSSGQATLPVITDHTVAWIDGRGEGYDIYGYDLLANREFRISTSGQAVNWAEYRPLAISEKYVVWSDRRYGNAALFAYDLGEGREFQLLDAPESSDEQLTPKISRDVVLWSQGFWRFWDLWDYNLTTREKRFISDLPSLYAYPVVSDRTVLWPGGQPIPLLTQEGIAGYDLLADHRFRIPTDRTPYHLALDDTSVVWAEGLEGDLYALDLTSDQPVPVATGGERHEHPAVSGSTVVWQERTDGQWDIFGADLGRPVPPPTGTVTGVIWYDDNADGQKQPDERMAGEQALHFAREGRAFTTVIGQPDGTFELDMAAGYYLLLARTTEPDITSTGGQTFTHRGLTEFILPPGASTEVELGLVPITATTEAKIQILWPHDAAGEEQSVAQAPLANLTAYLGHFRRDDRGEFQPVACDFDGTVQLWAAVNNEPARPIKTGERWSAYVWNFNDVDVRPAQNPVNKMYFFVTVDGVTTRSNVWAHALDARTFFPQQDTPTGVLRRPPREVDARIEVVWPHDTLGQPGSVADSDLANVTAALFAPRTLKSVPPYWEPTVRLFRAINDRPASTPIIGQKRLVRQGDLVYPVWDFNDVVVRPARDPSNRIFFWLDVEGVPTYSNVWAHASDARTFFPIKDAATNGCPP